eukprot:jgi/Astpho2/6483/Aster-x0730
MKQLMSHPDAPAFLLMAVCMGYGMGTYDGYFFLYLQDLGGPQSLMGLTIFTAACCEVPLFFFCGHLIRLLGVRTVLYCTMLTFALRHTCYVTLPWWPSVWMVQPVELLHGITFACAWAAGTVNCSRLSPPGFEATVQAIFSGLYFGLGHGLGGLCGGIIYQKQGGQMVFIAAVLVLLSGCLLSAIVQQVMTVYIHSHRRKHHA